MADQASVSSMLDVSRNTPERISTGLMENSLYRVILSEVNDLFWSFSARDSRHFAEFTLNPLPPFRAVREGMAVAFSMMRDLFQHPAKESKR